MAAPKGNLNARKPVAGVQVNFYLTAEEKEDIRNKLLEMGETPTDQAIREIARAQSRNGVRLFLKGKCSDPDCYQAATVECRIGKCAPLTRYCVYHYEQAHLPEDERDSNDMKREDERHQ